MSATAQTPSSGLPPLAPAYGEIPPTFWECHEIALIVAGLALVAFVPLFIWWLFQPEPPVIVPPEVVARQALAKLQGRSEDGKVLSEISQTVRRYVSVTLAFPAGELTTAEFSTALAGNAKCGPELVQTITAFLHECDQRKFSPTASKTPLKAAARALELVEQLRKQTNVSLTETGAR